MKFKKLQLGIVLLLGFGLSNLQAQENLNASGGEAIGSGGSSAYTIGQIVYQTYTGTSGNSLTEGVQQPYEISILTSIAEVKGISLSVLAYPNPTADYLIVEVKDFGLSNLSLQLYDMQGKLLQSEKITNNQTSVIMSNLVSATYFAKIVQGNQEVKTFKIIKK